MNRMMAVGTAALAAVSFTAGAGDGGPGSQSALHVSSIVLAQVQPANLNGKWQATLTDPQGDKHGATLEFEVDGGKVTGSFSGGPVAGVIPIVNGKLEGDQISFETDGEVHFFFTGRVSGNQIKGGTACGLVKISPGKRPSNDLHGAGTPALAPSDVVNQAVAEIQC